MIRRLAVSAAIAVLAIAAVVAATRGSEVQRYLRAEIVRAFGEQGFDLEVARGLGPKTLYENGRWIMGPPDGEFIVYVAASAAEARAWSTRHAWLHLPPPRFAVLRGNVLVESIGRGPSEAERKRVRRAIRALG